MRRFIDKLANIADKAFSTSTGRIVNYAAAGFGIGVIIILVIENITR